MNQTVLSVKMLGTKALDLMAHRTSEDNPEDGEQLEVPRDWWSKFNASCGIVEAGPKVWGKKDVGHAHRAAESNLFKARGRDWPTGPQYTGDLVQVLLEPLEAYHNFESPIRSFVLYRGKTGDSGEMGAFKGNVSVTRISEADVEAANAVRARAAAEKARASKSSKSLLAVMRKDETEDPLYAHYSATSTVWHHLPDKTATEVIVRLYVVRYAVKKT